MTRRVLFLAALCAQLVMGACGRDRGEVTRMGSSPDGRILVLREIDHADGGGLGKTTVRVFIREAHNQVDSETLVLDAIPRESACVGVRWVGSRELVVLYRGLETSTFRNVHYLSDQGRPGLGEQVEVLLARSPLGGDSDKECTGLGAP